MLFLNWTYLLFLVVTFLFYWFIIPTDWRRVFLFVTSTSFFFYYYPKATLLILVMLVFVYLLALFFAKRYKSVLLFMTGIVLVTAPLAYFKYTPLIVSSLNDLLALAGKGTKLTIPEIIIPLGISFFTFKLLHYLIDVYKGKIECLGLLDFALYIMFVPILPSGPIERYQSFNDQAREIKAFKSEYLTEGVFRLLSGLFKKYVIADSMTIFTSALTTTDASTISYWLAVYAYAFKIYFDFSGYSDIAIGSSRLFGYKIMENFDWPYLQRNISLFWKNWHISLTRWFTEYIFIPLGGSRASFGRIAFNTFVVMAVTGIWHGAAWHFMFWGLYHGVGLILLRIYGKLIAEKLGDWYMKSKLVTVFSTLFTFHFVAIGWVFFVVDIRQSFYVLGRLFMLN